MESEFDQYAHSYESLVEEAIQASGETALYFARQRVLWLQRCLSRRFSVLDSVLDYGCGVGTAAECLKEILSADTYLGVDVSSKAVEMARKRGHPAEYIFDEVENSPPLARFALVYSSAVFHHIPPEQRGVALRYIHDSLRTGGLFALWEHNWWSPATRWVMNHCVFDRTASPLTPPLAHRLLRSADFTPEQTVYAFIFPRRLSVLRPLEWPLRRLPLGAQFLILSVKE